PGRLPSGRALQSGILMSKRQGAMLHLLQILSIIFVALAMCTAVAHALEMPGKMRLAREAYFAVQPIYYPGFTVGGGLGEVAGLILTFVTLWFTPRHTDAFWLILFAFIGMAAMHAIFWVWTQPTNRYWL